MTSAHITKPSPYLWRKFLGVFDQGCRFWTSEDGNACEFVIARVDDWRKWFDDRMHGEHGIDIEATLATKQDGWVFQEWSGRGDYFDGGGTPGKIWRLSDEPTEFPVFVFDPKYLPRSAR